MSRRTSLVHEAMQIGIETRRVRKNIATVDEMRQYVSEKLRLTEKDRDFEAALQEFIKGYQLN